MEHQPFVYGLFDPAEAGHVRYVGMAPSNPSRPYQHAKRARKDLADDSHLMRWIRKIQAEGREPSVMILEQLREETGRAFLGFVESCYIKSLREIGHRLTNENDGGWGGSNGPHTPESRVAMKTGWTLERRARQAEISRERQLGRKFTEEKRAGWRDSWTPERRIASGVVVRERERGKTRSIETRAKQSASVKAYLAEHPREGHP
jgi:hypothetical protein